MRNILDFKVTALLDLFNNREDFKLEYKEPFDIAKLCTELQNEHDKRPKISVSCMSLLKPTLIDRMCGERCKSKADQLWTIEYLIIIRKELHEKHTEVMKLADENIRGLLNQLKDSIKAA